ncbi:peptide deformylase [Patescibacteria group bacterium]
MTVKPIITIPNKLLEDPTEKVGEITDYIKDVASHLMDTVLKAKDPEGAGLSANQIGVNKKMCVVRNFYKDPKTGNENSEDTILINPKVISHSNETEMGWEGCLSVPDTYGQVPRFKKLKVKAKGLDGKKIRITASGYFARVIQHELDHLNGILFTERVQGKTITEEELEKLFV